MESKSLRKVLTRAALLLTSVAFPSVGYANTPEFNTPAFGRETLTVNILNKRPALNTTHVTLTGAYGSTIALIAPVLGAGDLPIRLRRSQGP
jgi:hypothetical protein